ncbi:MAG: rhodanese-like domain-containing protein [bacterium]|nr:rhodanese-like domain-containing protein [bacterium]
MNILKSLFGGSGAGVVSASEAKSLLDSGTPPFVLDVREPSEYTSGHIAGATLVPLGQLEARMNELPKDRQIICVCASGGRSSMATQKLAKAGYDVVNLRGGMMGWQMEKYPIQKGN